MAQFNDQGFPTFYADSDLGIDVRVKLVAGRKIELCDDTEYGIGTVVNDAKRNGENKHTVKLHTQGTHEMRIASGASISDAGDPVYAAANGEIAEMGTVQIGVAAEAGAAGDTIEVIPVPIGYTLPIASASVLGGAKFDPTDFDVAPDGTVTLAQ